MYSSEIDTTVRRGQKIKGSKSLKGSDFIVTINTNKSFNDRSEKYAARMPAIEEKFKGLIETLFSETNLPKLVQEVTKEEGKTIRRKPQPGVVEQVKSKAVIESNETGSGFLHSHTYIHIKHRGKVQIDLMTIKNVTYAVMKDVLTFNGKFLKPYIQIKGVHSSATGLANYVN